MMKPKSDRTLVQVMISLPEAIRNKLHIIAAELTLHDQKTITSAASVARRIIIENIDQYDLTKIKYKK